MLRGKSAPDIRLGRMFRTSRSAILASAIVTIVGALAVPDYSSELWPIAFKPFVLPALLSLPLAIATFRSPAVLSLRVALLLSAAFLFTHVAISALIFWRRAGDALFDGLSIPILCATLALGVLTAGLVFLTTWALFRRRGTHAA